MLGTAVCRFALTLGTKACKMPVFLQHKSTYGTCHARRQALTLPKCATHTLNNPPGR